MFHESFGDRFIAPKVLDDAVALGRFGAKTGSGLVIKDHDQAVTMIDRRNRAYVAIGRLIDEVESDWSEPV